MTPSEPSSPGRRNGSGLVRDIAVLDVLARHDVIAAGGAGVVRIAELLGRDKTVVSRMLATLADAGLVRRDEETLAYRLGHRLFALAARTTEAALVVEARPLLRGIAQQTRETTHLCVLRGGNVLTLASEMSPHEVRTTGWAGVTTAAWRTPSGRALLSDWDEESLRRWYTEHGTDSAVVGSEPVLSESRFAVLDEPTDNLAVVRDFTSLLTEIGRVRARGFAASDEEFEAGVVAVSAPVIDFTGRVVAAVNISAPKLRVGGRLDELGRYLAKGVRHLSTSLGSPD